ncbi:Type I antifreeze protein [Legionella beliardensis]|uniref:Type I antifreeze protein n=1 Tax=Legionella beliardensis TaxID=91822 RepID=A0A378I970_9GAMM|nr:zinc ribbon domain-containing protein [Legionella beliardensis]STX28924.1 Type I antifreeze protein [Legionella beliardensis]
MPIYEYECANCHHKFDLMQKIHDAPATQCPQCFKDTAVRLISAAGFQLKGTGWYATDFKNKSSAPATQKGSGKESSDKSSSDVKTQTGEKGERD